MLNVYYKYFLDILKKCTICKKNEDMCKKKKKKINEIQCERMATVKTKKDTEKNEETDENQENEKNKEKEKKRKKINKNG